MVMEIPFDEEDWRFHQSFTVEELQQRRRRDDDLKDEQSSPEWLKFFHLYGFVIVRDVVDMAVCDSVIEDMLNLLQEQDKNKGQFERNDMATWKLSAYGTPRNAKGMFRPSLLSLRQDPNIVRSFAAILETDDIVCSHGRWLLHRPSGADKCGWPVGPRNIHLDLNPYIVDDPKYEAVVLDRLKDLRYDQHKDLREFITENNDVHSSMGLQVQGLLNLRDLPFGQNGGGTILVPGSHKSWPELSPEHRQEGAMQYRVDALLRQAQCVALRAGSLLIWNQRLIHGSTPNLRPCQPHGHGLLRAAVPIRFFSKDILQRQPQRAQSRAATIQRELEQRQFEPSALGRSVFGLE